MIKIEAITLDEAYTNAATTLKCSVSELKVEVVQIPSSGFLGFFKKSAIIVATSQKITVELQETKVEPSKKPVVSGKKPVTSEKKSEPKKEVIEEEKIVHTHRIFNDTIMPASFVSDQDDEEDDLGSGLDYTADYDDEFDENYEEDSQEDSVKLQNLEVVAKEVEEEINTLFNMTCFKIDKIDVSVYDEQTLLVEFKGEDAALLIGKEGYRYKALSYMIFNWFNSKYDLQLRLEIAEFLKNQEESVSRYLTNVYENIDRDGRAQTKILDGVLVQIALKELRERYPDKYVVIRSTKDGLKYIIVNDYHNN